MVFAEDIVQKEVINMQKLKNAKIRIFYARPLLVPYLEVSGGIWRCLVVSM